MITTGDKEYKYTKLIKQGKAAMNPDFIELADWIYKNYNAKPINIIYDIISGAGGKLMPRLEVIFEFPVDEDKFRNDPLNYFSYDEAKKEEIKQQFKKDIISKGFTLKKSFWNLFGGRIFKKYDVENMFVVFSSFEPIAKGDANNSIPESILKKLEEEINNPDLWKIVRDQSVTFFFYTDN